MADYFWDTRAIVISTIFGTVWLFITIIISCPCLWRGIAPPAKDEVRRPERLYDGWRTPDSVRRSGKSIGDENGKNCEDGEKSSKGDVSRAETRKGKGKDEAENISRATTLAPGDCEMGGGSIKEEESGSLMDDDPRVARSVGKRSQRDLDKPRPETPEEPMGGRSMSKKAMRRQNSQHSPGAPKPPTSRASSGPQLPRPAPAVKANPCNFTGMGGMAKPGRQDRWGPVFGGPGGQSIGAPGPMPMSRVGRGRPERAIDDCESGIIYSPGSEDNILTAGPSQPATATNRGNDEDPSPFNTTNKTDNTGEFRPSLSMKGKGKGLSFPPSISEEEEPDEPGPSRRMERNAKELRTKAFGKDMATLKKTESEKSRQRTVHISNDYEGDVFVGSGNSE